MLPYITLLVLPSFFSLINPRGLSPILWYGTLVLFILFVGLRFEVAPDWLAYVELHERAHSQSFMDVMAQAEPFSYGLFWVSEHVGMHVYLTNIVAAIVFLTGVFSFAKRTFNPWLAIVAATPYFIVVIGMSGVRQAMAAGIILFLLGHWEKYSFLKRFSYIVFAAMFHTSALVCSILLVVQMRVQLAYKLLLGALILAVTLYLALKVPVFAENVLSYQERYIENPKDQASQGSLYHIAFIIFPALLAVVFSKYLSPYIHNGLLLKHGIYAAFFVFLLNFVPILSTTLASRLTIYLYFLPMMVYPALTTLLGPRSWVFATVVIMFFHMAVLIGWLATSNHAYTYLPYQNLLFHL
jgi:hypothetical protein